jgi:hypothetical protein
VSVGLVGKTSGPSADCEARKTPFLLLFCDPESDFECNEFDG